MRYEKQNNKIIIHRPTDFNAEQILLSELKLDSFVTSGKECSIKLFSETFKTKKDNCIKIAITKYVSFTFLRYN